MVEWIKKHPRTSLDTLGYIRFWLTEDNPASAKEQLHANYTHGGGWRPFKGHTMLPNGDLAYPGDPPRRLLWEAKLREELVRVYQDAWVAVIQPSGEYEICRMD